MKHRNKFLFISIFLLITCIIFCILTKESTEQEKDYIEEEVTINEYIGSKKIIKSEIIKPHDLFETQNIQDK